MMSASGAVSRKGARIRSIRSGRSRRLILRNLAFEVGDEVEQETDQAESGFSAIEGVQAEAVSAKVVLELLDAVFAFGAAVVKAPGWHRVMPQGGDQDMKGIAGDLEQFAPARLGPFTDHFAHHHQPARGLPAVGLVAGRGRFQTAREGRPLTDTR